METRSAGSCEASHSVVIPLARPGAIASGQHRLDLAIHVGCVCLGSHTQMLQEASVGCSLLEAPHGTLKSIRISTNYINSSGAL